MKSIRLSLLVYFLLLLTAALGAVSWFSYQTTAQSLRQRKLDAEQMIISQYDARCKARAAELDRQILRQARAIASMPLLPVYHELSFAAMTVCEAIVPQGPIGTCVGTPMWAHIGLPGKEGAPFPIYIPLSLAEYKVAKDGSIKFGDVKRVLPSYFPKYMQSSEFLVANADADHPQEYFQTYFGQDEHPMQRSESMGDAQFTLKKSVRKSLALFSEDFDYFDLKPSVRVRRVTLKTPVAGYGVVRYWPPWYGPPPPGAGQFGGKGGNPKGPKALSRPFDAKILFIQYAADMEPLNEKNKQYEASRDEQLANLETSIRADLHQLRNRMLGVSLITLAAIWLGGFGVIQLGLAPLWKMSDAVSKVSPKNFHLSVNPDSLPNELQPIAARLQEVLLELQQAFAREKQAAADISHELRTPLAALMTTLEVGLRKVRSPDEYREILEDSRSSGQHMYHLVERLLTLARLDAGVDQYHPRQVDVVDSALQCADMIRPLAKARGIAMRLNVPDAATLQTDPDKLREVIVNLLHNAVEYNQPNGTIELSAEAIQGKVRLIVRDTGIGIKPDALGHIFERFYRADPSRHADTPHAGLGLSIVKSYVDLMGGTIKVDSSGAGTSFTIELPCIEPIAPKEFGALAMNAV